MVSVAISRRRRLRSDVKPRTICSVLRKKDEEYWRPEAYNNTGTGRNELYQLTHYNESFILML